METNKLLDYPHSSKYVILCLSEERNSYRFEMTLKQIYLTEATLFDYPVINFLIILKCKYIKYETTDFWGTFKERTVYLSIIVVLHHFICFAIPKLQLSFYPKTKH